MNNPPQNERDLYDLREVHVPVIIHFNALVGGRLLRTEEETLPIPLDRKLRTLLNWTVKDHGICYDLAMTSILLTWLEEMEKEKGVQDKYRKEYPDFPDFSVSYHPKGTVTWIKK